MWILFHEVIYSRFDKCSASVSPLGELKSVLSFRVNAVFGWMPCHNSQQKLTIFMYLAVGSFAFWTASLFFLTSVLQQRRVTVNLELREKKRKSLCFSFDIPV